MAARHIAAGAPTAIAFLNWLFLVSVLAAILGILGMAMLLQYAGGELPCPLCLLERVAMMGICLGIVLHIRGGFSWHNTGTSLLFAVLLLVIAARQSLLDITPRPGHAYVGSAILGLHMPVWGVVIGLGILVAFSLKIALLGSGGRLEATRIEAFPALAAAGRLLSLALVAVVLVNAVSVIVQCGAGECHSFGYRLLGGPAPP